jgi:hypothetical protein
MAVKLLPRAEKAILIVTQAAWIVYLHFYSQRIVYLIDAEGADPFARLESSMGNGSS